MAFPQNPNGGPLYPGNPYNPKVPIPVKTGASATLGGNPGLVTSTGGLFGINGLLLTPVFNTKTGKSYILLMNPNNFNCEENCEYDFPQEIPPRNAPQEGRDVSCHLIILKYREIGYAQFTINVTTFQKNTDTFTTYPYDVSIPPLPLTSKARKQAFPDQRIHTLRIPIDVPGERPQVSITSNGNAGPYSIISLVLCGNADESTQQ
jgi:hypothetical protein